jgi:hypothetical protein
MGSEETYVVRRGRLLCYRILDVGDEVDLELADRLLRGSPGHRRLRPSREGSESLAFTSPPLSVAAGHRTVSLPRTGRPVEAEVAVHLYDYAAAGVAFEVEIPPGTALGALGPLCDELYDTPVLEAEARAVLAELLPRIAPAIQGPHDWPGTESYTVIFVEELDGRPTAAEVLAMPGLAKLLLGETAAGTLSAAERADVLKHAYSYFEHDLAVIDWNSAFVLEPSGSRDIPDILEFATSQLLELRYYDTLLDGELARLYDEFAAAKRRFRSLLWSPYGTLAREVQKRLVELTEFTERVENALKIIGDFYLARVYRAAVRRFRMPSWQESVYRKQSLVAGVYTLLKGELDIRRNTLLELTIVLLIVFEIVMAFL